MFLKTVHHCFEDGVSDFSLFERESIYEFLVANHCSNFITNTSKPFPVSLVFVRFAFLYALLRIHICFLIKVVIHGGSVGRIVTCLLGIQESLISIKRL